MLQAAGRSNRWRNRALEYAEDDGTDKGERDIRGDNAQSADESHGKVSPWFTSLPALTPRLANRSGRKKSALLSLATSPQTPEAANVVKES
jgi:hypothetical protein